MIDPRATPTTNEQGRQAARAPRMTVTWNGAPQPVPLGATVAEAIAAAGVRMFVYMIELNGELVRHEDFDHVNLDAGDIVELIHLPYGG